MESLSPLAFPTTDCCCLLFSLRLVVESRCFFISPKPKLDTKATHLSIKGGDSQRYGSSPNCKPNIAFFHLQEGSGSCAIKSFLFLFHQQQISSLHQYKMLNIKKFPTFLQKTAFAFLFWMAKRPSMGNGLFFSPGTVNCHLHACLLLHK